MEKREGSSSCLYLILIRNPTSSSWEVKCRLFCPTPDPSLTAVAKFVELLPPAHLSFIPKWYLGLCVSLLSQLLLCLIPVPGAQASLAQPVPNSARVSSAKTSWSWRTHGLPCPEGIFHIKIDSIAGDWGQRRKMKEVGTYPSLLTPGTGCSVGRNANFIGPGKKEGKLLCSWLVCWDGRLLLLSSCMHC